MGLNVGGLNLMVGLDEQITSALLHDAFIQLRINTALIANGQTGSFQHPLEFANPSSSEATRFFNFVDTEVSNPGSQFGFWGFNAALAYKLTGNEDYKTLALTMLSDQILNAITAVTEDDEEPPIAFNQYLYIYYYMRDVVYILEWCGQDITTEDREIIEDYAEQSIWNLWNHSSAEWFGESFPWAGWSVNNPGNNYYHSFISATAFWALYKNSETWLDFLRDTKFPELVSYMNTNLIEGGSREGTNYGTSHDKLFELYAVWELITGEDIHTQMPMCVNSPLYWMHCTSPDGSYLAPLGDQSRVIDAQNYDYTRAVVSEAIYLYPSHYNSSIGRWYLQNHWPQMTSGFNFYQDLLDISGVVNTPIETSYAASGAGHFFVRSDWTEGGAWLTMMCGPRTESHQFEDNGAFHLWGKGKWLLTTQNSKTHSGIEQSTQWHNMLRFVQMPTSGIIEQSFDHSGIMTFADNGSVVTASMKLDDMYVSQPIKWTRDITYTRPSGLNIVDSYSTPHNIFPNFQINFSGLPQVSGNLITDNNIFVTVNHPASPSIVVQHWRGISSDFDVSNPGYRVNIAGPSGVGQFNIDINHQLYVSEFAPPSAILEVGEGKQFTSIGQVPWSVVGPDTEVRIFHKSTPYKEKMLISSIGAEGHPIRIKGMLSEAGERPVICGHGATTASNTIFYFAGHADRGTAMIGPRTGWDFGDRPQHIIIENLEFRFGYRASDVSPSGYFDHNGSGRFYSWNAAGLWVERGNHILVSGCKFYGNGNGYFVAPESRDIRVINNEFEMNGSAGRNQEHHSYIETSGVIYEGNYYGAHRPTSLGTALKDRSAGTVIRYNFFNNGGSILNDLVEHEDGYDAFAGLSIFNNTLVYGNIYINTVGGGAYITHFGGDLGVNPYRPNLLFAYNTIVSFRNQSESFRLIIWRCDTQGQKVYADNNVIYSIPLTEGQDPQEICLTNWNGVIDFGVNWLSPGWLPGRPDTFPLETIITGSGNLLDNTGNNPGISLINLAPQPSSILIGAAQYPVSGIAIINSQYDIEELVGTISRLNMTDVGAISS